MANRRAAVTQAGLFPAVSISVEELLETCFILRLSNEQGAALASRALAFVMVLLRELKNELESELEQPGVA